MTPTPMLRVVPATSADGRHANRDSILVAVLTFRRPCELEAFLEGYAAIASPPDADVALLVVDNDARGSGRATVDAYRDRIRNLQYVIEPRVGIPVARNRALDEALASGADALCFIDDDEVPEPDWLVNLVGAWRRSGADLVGGPVGVSPVPPTATPWQRFINASLVSRSRRKYAGTAKAAASDGHYTIVTNNWLCDLRWLASSGLRFDERLLLTGGSDTAFCRTATAAGCRRAWAADAIVHETIPPDRLTLGYQFWRGASQSITHFRMKHDRVTPALAVTTAVMSLVRAVAGFALLVVPVFGIGSLAIAVRSLGWAVGRIQALRGAESTLYAFAVAPPPAIDSTAFASTTATPAGDRVKRAA